MVLIVEDERISRKALATLLAASGFHVEAVSSAEEGLRIVRQGHVPNVALVDLDLPGMDGAEFIQKLHEQAPQVQPILLTAADRERVATRFKENDSSPALVRHVHKPVDFQHLLHVLEET